MLRNTGVATRASGQSSSTPGSRAALLILAAVCVGLLLLLVPINLGSIRQEAGFRTASALVAPWVPRTTFAAYWLTRDFAVAPLCVLTALFITGRRAEEQTAWLAGALLVTLPIIGATKITHLQDALGALSVKLTQDEVAYLEEPYVPHRIVGHQ